MAKICFTEFKQIHFKDLFPNLILDIIEYLTGYSIAEALRIEKELKEQRESATDP